MERLPIQDFLVQNNQYHQQQKMKFNHYPKRCFTIPLILRSRKVCTIYINTLSTINNLNPTSVMVNICHQAKKKCYAINRITIRLDGYDIFDGMTFMIDILIEVSIFASFLCLLIIVFDKIDLNFDETSECKYGCGNKKDANMISMKINIYHRKEYNFDIVNQIIVGINADGAFNIIIVLISIAINVLRLPSFLDALSIIFDGINSNLHRLIEYECNHRNNNKITVVLANVDTIRGTAIVFEFCTIVIYFIIQVIDESSLNILLLIEFDAIIITITQLVLKLIEETIIWPVLRRTQVIRSVCGVFSLLFVSIVYFFGLG